MQLVSVDEGSPAVSAAAPGAVPAAAGTGIAVGGVSRSPRKRPRRRLLVRRTSGGSTAWVLRHEQHILANDLEGEDHRANAAEVRRKIEAALALPDIFTVQTLTLQAPPSAGNHTPRTVPTRSNAASSTSPANSPRPARRCGPTWMPSTAIPKRAASRGAVLIEWVASDPVPRLGNCLRLRIPRQADGFSVGGPAELNSFAMLARHLRGRQTRKGRSLSPLSRRCFSSGAESRANRVALRIPTGSSSWPTYAFAEFLNRTRCPHFAHDDKKRL